jgi:Na+/H+-dicarboxylate symporter
MRWKMLLLTALVAALGGALLTIIFVLVGDYLQISSAVYVEIVAVFILICIGLVAGIFAYRHTARRRALQGVLTLTLAALAFTAILIGYHFLFEDRPGSPAFYKRLGGGSRP